AVGLGGDVEIRDGPDNQSTAYGSAGVVISGQLADVLVVPAGDDVVVVETAAGGVTAEVPKNIDPARRAARVSLDGAPATVLPGGRQVRTDLARTLQGAAGRRGGRRRPRVHRAGRRLRQGPRAVWAADRHLPGGEASLRQHAGGGRAGDRGGLGRRPRRRGEGGWGGGRGPAQLHRGD